MARLTVEQIMESIAATVNQEAVAPSGGSSEHSLWLKFINRSYFEWAEANDWEELRKQFLTTTAELSGATIPMPQDFRKIASSPRLHTANGLAEGEEYPDIPQEKRGLYSEHDKYVYMLGSQSEGYNLIFHPGSLGSGASLEVWYYANVTSLASPSQVPLAANPDFLIDRTIAYVLEARSDPRFQEQEVKAREKLLQMAEQSSLMKFNSYGTPQYVETAPLAKRGFRVGRD